MIRNKKMPVCKKCLVEKLTEEFGLYTRKGRGKRSTCCNTCRASYERDRRSGLLPIRSSSPKQIVQVLDAIQNGIGTSSEIGEFLGKSVRHVSSYLTILSRDGFIQWTGRTMMKVPGGTGRACRVYEVRP